MVRSDSGSMSLEVVLVVPVLMLLVLFVLWAGRGGRAALMADLVAEEAATAASLACEEGEDRECEELVADVLSARPGLDFLCIGGARSDRSEGLVDHNYIRFVAQPDPDDPGSFLVPEASGVGLYGVQFLCETDGATWTSASPAAAAAPPPPGSPAPSAPARTRAIPSTT